jgi:hypothetical protein
LGAPSRGAAASDADPSTALHPATAQSSISYSCTRDHAASLFLAIVMGRASALILHDNGSGQCASSLHLPKQSLAQAVSSLVGRMAGVRAAVELQIKLAPPACDTSCRQNTQDGCQGAVLRICTQYCNNSVHTRDSKRVLWGMQPSLSTAASCVQGHLRSARNTCKPIRVHTFRPELPGLPGCRCS